MSETLTEAEWHVVTAVTDTALAFATHMATLRAEMEAWEAHPPEQRVAVSQAVHALLGWVEQHRVPAYVAAPDDVAALRRWRDQIVTGITEAA